jgi:large subunit ribosomal protein L9
MKVILLQDVYNHGVAGEVVDVAAGFARNYLIPRRMAQRATKGALKQHQNLMAEVTERRDKYQRMLNELARKIDGVELIFERRANNSGTLFGSVTTQEIADALYEKTDGDVDINRRRISQQPLREIGQYTVPVRIGNEDSPELQIVIVREGETEEFLKAREEAAEDATIDPLTLEPEGEASELPEDIPTAAELSGEEPAEIIQKSDVEQAIDEAAEESGLVPEAAAGEAVEEEETEA